MLKKIILVGMLFLGLLNATNISTDKVRYTPNENIKTTFTAMSGDDQDWIAIYPVESSNDWGNVIQWTWAKAVNGNYTFNALPVGEYEIRAFFNNSYHLEASKNFTVLAEVNEVASITTSKDIYTQNEKPVIKFSNLSGNNKDWIAIYPKESSNAWNNVIQWNWAKAVNGTHTFNELPIGNYEARAFFNNSYHLEASKEFNIEHEAENPVTLTVNKASYSPNEQVVAQFSNLSKDDKNWIAIYPKGSSNAWNNVIQWDWTRKINGTYTFNSLPLGNYEVRVFFKNSFTVEQKITFSVEEISIYSAIRKRMDDAINKINNKVVYIVTGDSTRHNHYNMMIEYYTTQLNKTNIRVYNNAQSGQRGEFWKNNISTATIQKALTQTEGDGENTILEYSFGINDFRNGTEAEVKQWLKEGLITYMNAKPKSLVLLVAPVATTNQKSVESLTKTYQELSVELNLPLVDALIPTTPLLGNPLYYKDNVHPNANGSEIIVNYILSEVGSQLLKDTLEL